MTTLTPLPAIAVLYFLYVGVTEGFTAINTTLLLVALALFAFSLKRKDPEEPAEDDEDRAPTAHEEGHDVDRGEGGEGASPGGRT